MSTACGLCAPQINKGQEEEVQKAAAAVYVASSCSRDNADKMIIKICVG